MNILVPRYASPSRPNGIIPPSPPAETREARRAEILRLLRTYTGRMPPVSLPGYDERPRIILPGMPGYQETLRRAVCMPAGSACVMGGAPPNPLASLTDAKVYWKFEDLTDSTGNGNTLTATGGPTFNTGKLGNAAYLVENGATKAYYSAADSASFKPGTSSAFSINFWGRIGTFSNQAVFVDRGIFSAGDAFNFYKASTGNLEVNWGDGTLNSGLDLVATVADATWYMFTLVVVPGASGTRSYTLYQNNSVIASVVNTGTVSGTGQTATCYIGRRGDNGTFPTTLDVRVDDFSFYWRAITSGEVALFWNGGSGASAF